MKQMTLAAIKEFEVHGRAMRKAETAGSGDVSD
jgi:hypothetical protein